MKTALEIFLPIIGAFIVDLLLWSKKMDAIRDHPERCSAWSRLPFGGIVWFLWRDKPVAPLTVSELGKSIGRGCK